MNRACCCAGILLCPARNRLIERQTEVEVSNKKLNIECRAQTAADSDKKMRIYFSASIVANTM